MDVDEALRYLGASAADDTLRRQMEAIAREAEARFAPKWVWRACSVVRAEDVLLPEMGLHLPGKLAARMLADCDQAAVLMCTLGLGFDSWLRSLQARDMAKAVLADACGSAMVEAGCDSAQREIADRFPGMHQTDRFSPGYGDLPLTAQTEICRALGSRLGVHLTESCLMNPQKSVSAIIGLSEKPQRARIRGCAYCSLRDTCEMRKGGRSCAV